MVFHQEVSSIAIVVGIIISQHMEVSYYHDYHGFI
jgi:hypothetical protein